MVYKRLQRLLIQLDAVDSTNDFAIDLMKSKVVSSGTVVITDHQQNGRGQRSNTWTTEGGKNLTFSLILSEKIPVNRSFYLNIVASLAVRKALKDLQIDAKIKWPNDILVEDKKICGILIENQIQGDSIKSSVIGIGLNVNQVEFGKFEATSIHEALNSEVELKDIFDQLYGYLDFYLNVMLEQNYDLLLKHYYDHLYRLNELYQYEDKEGKFQGSILGIHENGLLKVKREDEIRMYDLKEISYC